MKSIKKAATMDSANKPQALANVKPSQLKIMEESLMKFSDLLIASTSVDHDELCFWEPKTLAPYEPLIEKKFVAAPNTLQVSSANHVIAAHGQKTTASIWRWDKKEPILRFPLKDQLSVLKLSPNGGSLCLAGSKGAGRISVWEVATGFLLGEVENAHYMDVTDLDISIGCDLVITGGKDFKVKVWVLADLLFGGKAACFAEFSDHTAEVT